MVHLEEDLEEDGVGVNADPLTCVRRAVWGLLYADDAGIVSKSAEGLAKMIAIIVTVSPCPRRRRRPCCCGHRIRYPGRHPSSSNQQARDIDRQRC